ncbi:DMT family transporter [Peribacillus sp. SCS-37]|uniref:DMT family transporter n=1 Tax=Paraperibacillus esterisolvens TaxID=3115296 RepID=UPI0039065284
MAASILILAAGILWGIIGVFVRELREWGLSAMDIVAVRAALAAAILLLGGILFKRKEMKIKLADSYLFAGTGICSMVFFNWCYFTAIDKLGISLSAILLYTAPAFVLMLSALIFKERLTKLKAVLVLVTLAGCTFAAGTDLRSDSFEWAGSLIGVGAGAGYALYTIFAKAALRKYSSYTISLYTFIFAIIPLAPMTHFWGKLPPISNGGFWGSAAGLGLLSTVLAYLLYTAGLKGLEGSKASMLASIEPVTAVTAGFFLFGDSLTAVQLAGAILVISAVLAISAENGLKNSRKLRRNTKDL